VRKKRSAQEVKRGTRIRARSDHPPLFVAQLRHPAAAPSSLADNGGAFSFMDLPRFVGYAGLSKLLETYEMARGTVKWFNSQKGYGFIQPQGGGGRDVFVHISAVEKAGLPGLNEGQVVEYEEVSNRGKTSAENLKVSR
jgi:cold shock protein